MMGWSGVGAKRDVATVTDPTGDAGNHGGVTGSGWSDDGVTGPGWTDGGVTGPGWSDGGVTWPGWSEGGLNGVDVEKETEMSWNTKNWRRHVGLTSPRGADQSRDGTTYPASWASWLSGGRSAVT